MYATKAIFIEGKLLQILSPKKILCPKFWTSIKILSPKIWIFSELRIFIATLQAIL